MKIKYIIGLVLAALVFAGCDDDDDIGSLDHISVDKTYITIPADGGNASVNMKTSRQWKMEGVPDWLTVSDTTGTAGEYSIEFRADATSSGRETEIRILTLPDSLIQYIKVRQGSMEASEATCAEVIAGNDGKTFLVTGTCTAIANTTYGNWYLTDETGEIYIYGTLDANGASKNFLSLGIEQGDVVTVQGQKSTYNGTVELVNVTVVSITKSLMKVVSDNPTVAKDGGTFQVKAAYKGNGAFVNIPDEYKDWIKLSDMEYIAGIPTKLEASPADTALITFTVEANTAGKRTGSVILSSANSETTSNVTVDVTQEGAIVDINIADFNLLEAGEAQYRIVGVISRISNAAKGRFYIKDYSGETYVYNMSGFESLGLKEGDIVTLVGNKGVYNTTQELLNAELEASTPVTEISIADFLTQEDSHDKYYKLTGTIDEIVNTTYGNLYLTDDAGNRLYVYGCYPGYGATGDNRKNFLAAAGIKAGDKLTMIGYKDTYKGTIELCGGIYVSHESAE